MKLTLQAPPPSSSLSPPSPSPPSSQTAFTIYKCFLFYYHLSELATFKLFSLFWRYPLEVEGNTVMSRLGLSFVCLLKLYHSLMIPLKRNYCVDQWCPFIRRLSKTRTFILSPFPRWWGRFLLNSLCCSTIKISLSLRNVNITTRSTF